MSKIKYSINFVIPSDGKYENYKSFRGDIDKEWELFNCGEWAWIIQTYHRLIQCQNSHFTITKSEKPDINAVNIIFSDDYIKLSNKKNFYCAVIVQDRFVFYPGDLTIVQNRAHRLFFDYQYMTLWSQAGLIKKQNKLSSDDKIRIGFFGLPENSIDLVKIVDEIGHSNLEVAVASQSSWNDYSKIDIAVGIRDFSGKSHIQKPPTKLLNAWNAGVPFIGGADSAYSQVGEHLKNYICVTNKDELTSAINFIVESPRVSTQLIENGSKEFEKYSNRSLESEWVKLLNSEIVKFKKWKRKPYFRRYVSNRVRSFFYNYLRVKRRVNMLMGRYK
ncbi:hypothetical protein VSVS12_00381 [Vibrio scophthalmi]|uniref:glycosyltransferase n=1 Tax=Vibrio scophthalmi TaxID=45658 RepID=UPI00080974F3|nr:hypothetical protein [Vibrio scophthalmi]ANS84198.1 hypothetical protein VSVS12_00381 [Vibrio scophthalmi]